MDVTTTAIRRLVDRPVSDRPVTSVYLNTDGARYPKASDYEARLDGLLRDAKRGLRSHDPTRAQAVAADAEAIARWVRDDFDRGDVRGIGVFATAGEVLDTVQVAVGVRDVVRVNDRPYVVPLEVLLGRHHHIGLVLIERDKARIFRYRLGRAEEWFDLVSDVHGQHEQGGWSQGRYQRGIEHERLHHFKDASEILRKAHTDEPFDALVVAGPQSEAAEFSRQLHPYLQKVVHGDPLNLPAASALDDVKARLATVEQELVSGRRAELLQRLAASHGQGEKAARGIRHVVEAVNAKSIEVLFVVEGAGVPGFRSASGALALHEDDATAYGTPVAPVADLIDEIIEEAVRSDAHIELFRDEVRLDGHPVAALLRF